ncbi:MAG: protein kinase [Myxococcales bacterium]|nr:protein kinase [Myxococcales bacterium]
MSDVQVDEVEPKELDVEVDAGDGDDDGGDVEWAADELIPFGKYVLLDRLSSGATAAVYRAHARGEAGFERVLAIKRILPHMAGDPEFVKTFVREAKTTARLTHANICSTYELGKVGESIYMAVEYVAGKDLGRIQRQLRRNDQSMSPVLAAWVAARLCDALDYAHNLKNMAGERIGIVHRDLSPTNIVISYEGQVKLIDFGLAKAVGRSQQTNVDALKKKLSYMSPEMIKGKPPDARSDLFGVGISLYEMLTGRRLFAGKDDIATLTAVGKASVPPPSALMDDAPEDLELILMRALERDPEDRWQSAAEMGDALNHFLHKHAPTYGINALSDWMHELFRDEIEKEQLTIRGLLDAAKDQALIRKRRAFFSSPDGAAARARAEVVRKLSTRPPETSLAAAAAVPKAGKVPAEAVAAAATPAGTDPLREDAAGGFEDQPTAFYGAETAQAPAQPAVALASREAAAAEGFVDEATQFLLDGDLESMVVEGQPEPEDYGFEEEPTEIFFNKEDGMGLAEMLEEIHDVQPERANLNRPIVSPELLAPTPSPVPPAPLAGGPLSAPPPGPMGRASMPPSMPPAMPPAAIPPAAGALPVPLTRPLPTAASASVAPSASSRSWPIWLAAALLLLTIVGLVTRTQVGVALGVRAAPVGTIDIRTVPVTDANVELDGVYRGAAPLRIGGVQPGLRRVGIKAKGYEPVERELEIKAGSTAMLEIALTAKSSEGPAAGVEPTSETDTADEGKPGDSDGAEEAGDDDSKRSRSSRRRSRRKSRSGAAAAADATSGEGTLVVNSVPWAHVYIDGRDTGRKTPLMGYRLPVGSHEIKLQTEGGQTHVQQVQVEADQTVRVTRRF